MVDETMEAWIDAIADHAAYHKNDDGLPSHSLLDCPHVGPLLRRSREQDAEIARLREHNSVLLNEAHAERDAMEERLRETTQEFHHRVHHYKAGSFMGCGALPCRTNQLAIEALTSMERGQA